MRRLVGLVITTALSAQIGADGNHPGPWKRHVSTPKDGWFDAPPPFPLEHFVRYPGLLDEAGDFCYLCSPQKKLTEAMAAKEPKAEVHRVGSINGLEVYDVFYRFQTEGEIDWKSILVKTAPNSYREIYHCQPTQIDARALPSVIVKMDAALVLNSRYIAGGNKGSYWDDYYWFGEEGPTLIDFKPVFAAALAALPKGLALWRGGDSNSPEALRSMKFKLRVWGADDALCCRPGIVEVAFKLDHGRVIVTQAQYRPDGQE